MAYGIGVGREGFTWQGKNKITRKAEWPGWTPPQVMRDRVKRQEGRVLPAYMPGGPDNPLVRARDVHRLDDLPHPRHQPALDDRQGHVVWLHPDGKRGRQHLYDQVKIGTRVVVRN
jgi:lipoprotein-anchoring transpeptidase ErfK/SrfK